VKKSKITQNSLPVPCSLAPTTIFNAHLLMGNEIFRDRLNRKIEKIY
jgi:hypothetical protein